MKYLIVLFAVLGSACASPAAPTPPQAASVPAPAPISPANFQYGSGTLLCLTGFCSSFTMALTDVGPGCATNVRATVWWYGADGAVLLPNTPSIPMGAPGGLSAYTFRPGMTIVLTSLGGFNDVRSAHTVYEPAVTWTNVAC